MPYGGVNCPSGSMRSRPLWLTRGVRTNKKALAMMKAKMIGLNVLAGLSALMVMTATSVAQESDAFSGTKMNEKGESLFRVQCSSCHSLQPPHKPAGPHLQGIFGRKAGTVEGFKFSKAMKDSGVVWSVETIDALLGDPAGFIRGTSMRMLPVAEREDRAAIIDYMLETTKLPAE